MLKKIVALILLIAIASLPFASCGDGDTATSQTPSGGTQDSTLKAEYPLEENLKFEGEKIRLYSRAKSWFYYEMTLNPDEIANPIHQSVYDRELYVEEKLGIEITNEKESATDNETMTNNVQVMFESNTDIYDIIANSGTNASTSSMLEGWYYDFNDTEYIDTSMPWYSAELIKSATVFDQLYCLNGYLTLSTYQMGFVTFFNKNLLDQYHSGIDLYDEVDNHNWTLDRMFDLSVTVYEDTDLNGKANEGDLYGLAVNDIVCLWSFWNSCYLRILEQDENGVPCYGLDEERTQNAIEKLCDLYHNNPGVIVMEHTSGDGEFDRCMTQFSSNLYLFAHLRLLSVEGEQFTNMNSDYGILPPPLLDSDQEKYSVGLHDQYTLIFLMGTMDESRLGVASAFIELMSWYSYCYTIDAYAEVALKGRYSRDEDSRRMIDIIVEGVYIEPGEVWEGVTSCSGATVLNSTVKPGNKEGLASVLRSKKALIEHNLAKIDKFYSENES